MGCFDQGKGTAGWMKQILFSSRLLALIVLLVYAPVLLTVGILILATSHGPAFVKKAYRRPSHSDTVVYLYEFRTECWRTWQQTPVGSFLRVMDMHRLPRLANILTGEVYAGERVERVYV